LIEKVNVFCVFFTNFSKAEKFSKILVSAREKELTFKNTSAIINAFERALI
jgi:hypothetical protein